MAKKKPAAKRDATKWVAGSMFRLGPEVLADMDAIADDLFRKTGVPHSRTDVIRALVRREVESIRTRK